MRQVASDGYYEEVKEAWIIPVGSSSESGALIGIGPRLCGLPRIHLPRRSCIPAHNRYTAGHARRGTDQGPPNTDRLSVQAAAQRLGISEEAVRGRIKRGTLESERVGGRVYVLVEQPGGDRTNDQPSALVESLKDQVRYLRVQLQAEREARTEESRRHDTIVAQLTSRIPIEAPTESPGEPTEATEQPGRMEPQRAVEEPQAESARAVVAEDVRRIVAFLYESPLLDLEIYRLITILEASPALAEFEGSLETDRNKVDFLRRGFEFAEVSRIVVSLAAIIRSTVDANPKAYAGYPDRSLKRPVGVLMPDATKPHVWEALEFREACNKVLHADRVDPERTPPDTGALTGRLTLYGRHRRKDWEAKLDLRDYAVAALSLTY
jgi:hypothetical protein